MGEKKPHRPVQPMPVPEPYPVPQPMMPAPQPMPVPVPVPQPIPYDPCGGDPCGPGFPLGHGSHHGYDGFGGYMNPHMNPHMMHYYRYMEKCHRKYERKWMKRHMHHCGGHYPKYESSSSGRYGESSHRFGC
ncbi:hypothetical protein [Salinithrix halophila]|uniref:Uncharacterized protein n=1 Tax=Salinithrix halophila TaxID=1485204 RepID=A0ABV8JJN9_9BACL